ncbi:MAG: GyrI-like domain-containing protein [Beijerinckiaceae bacterium]|nr:GyrI-like domain-containing protein [Beijerinckiaceae bacterium]
MTTTALFPATLRRPKGMMATLRAGAVALLAILAFGALALPAFAQAPPPSTAEASAGNLVEVAPRPALTFDGQSSWDDSYTSILNAFQRLKSEADRAGLKTTGRPIAVFLFTDDAGFRFRAMTPLAEEPSSPSLGAEFAIGKTPSGRAVKFEHRGAYDEIDATYEAITAWLDDRNLLAEDFFAEEWIAEGTSAGDMDVAVDVYVFVKK